ncbi:MAG: NAD-dependent malic enzyme [Acidimicrobiia bacterium]|nr:MAG: NAD-dependent malic enzyme [Acidimicrobiia bacterium]
MRFTTHIDRRTDSPYLSVAASGETVLLDAFLNKGDAFTRDEREQLGLIGLLPDHVASIEEQLGRVRYQYGLKTSEMGKNIYLNGLMDRNETLFYRFVLENLAETVPVIYTPTVATACSHWSRSYRRAHGLYITPRDRGRIKNILRSRSAMAPPVIVVTDNERILGIGDQGAGGLGIPIGKLALYTAAAGIHPERTIPISIDVGTNNEELLADPLYVGYRERRVRGAEYEGLIDEFVDAVRDVYPGALLQWEDFANVTSFRNLETHRGRISSFNDDIQGTASMVVAGVLTASRHLGTVASDHRVVISGAGSAGYGIASYLAFVMIASGLTAEQAWSRLFVLDSKGLLLSDRGSLDGVKAALATDPADISSWDECSNPPSLLDVVRNVQPTVLIGVSGVGGLFTREVVEEMAHGCERPVILPLSNPTSHSEVTPQDAISWTKGRAIVAAGSPFAPVVFDGTTHRIGQANNVFIFPGMGLGIITVRAREVTDSMFLEASKALSSATRLEDVEQGLLYPHIEDVRDVSRTVAIAVARRAIEDGVADPVDDVEAAVEAEMWFPEYTPMRAADETR